MKLFFSVLIAAFALVTSAKADIENHFKDRTLTIVVPYGVGGSYDKYARVMARHLNKYIPSNPTIIVQNMKGRGGNKAMNWIYNIAPKNGYVMVVPLQTAVLNQLLHPKRTRYDAEKMYWLGSSNQTNMIGVSRKVKSLEDWKKRNLTPISGDNTKLGAAYLTAKITAEVLDLPVKLVVGYKGSSRTLAAIERGELDTAFFNWMTYKSKVPQWFKGDKPFASRFVQVGLMKDPDLPSVPLLSDIAPKKYMDVVRLISSPGLFGRGLALPPGVDPQISLALRQAYSKMNKDPEYKAELEKRRLRLVPTEGEVLQKMVSDVKKNTTEEVLALTRKLYESK